MAQVDYKELKKNGFMPQADTGRFSMRLRIAGGHIESGQLGKVRDIAERFGRGYIHMTSRQSIEIPFIRQDDIETVKKELSEAGLQPAAGGARVRTITACQGSGVCLQGNIDSQQVAQEFDLKYYGLEVPHKFKIGITGCRNNCLKAEENDLGVKGGIQPSWKCDRCSYCGACEAVCPVKALAVQKQDGKLSYDLEKCIACGKCVKACPAEAWEGKRGYIIYFGGLFGNRIQVGRQLFPIIFTLEKLNIAVETALDFFRRHGKKGERFGNTLERVGWDKLSSEMKAVLEEAD